MNKERILIVDDIEVNREILAEILQEDYDILQAKDGFEAIEIVMHNASTISLILLDIMMPEMDGYEVLKILRSSGTTNKIPVIIITAAGSGDNEVKGLENGAVDFVSKPFHPQSVKCRVDTQIELRKHRQHLEKLVNNSVEKVMNVREAMVDFLASVIEYRHIESGQHVMRTRKMAQLLFDFIKNSHKMDKEIAAVNVDLAVKAVPLHDIGKIGTPDSVLFKPGKLTDEEFAIIKQHTVTGAEMVINMKNIESAEYLNYCHDICLYHHERWDGTGYPHGLKGDKIPFIARVMAIIDVYDALTSARVYKPALSHKEAIEIFKAEAGKQFDPVMTEIFLENHESFAKLL